ncbi:MAG: FAD-binding oxidoreductase, partial [Verrucomicrobia bacterium]|nr:FAD-binding oxidoreductase [Cytophagales bacterium]
FFASSRRDVKMLKKELPLRKQMGSEIAWLEKKEIAEKFHLEAPAALLSGLAAQVDAFQLTHALLQKIKELGGKVFDTTTVSSIEHPKEGGIRLQTEEGFTINARKLVMAAGYESQNYLPDKKIIKLNSTYALISKPFPENGDLWQRNSLIWETAHPYLYLRTTADNRILVGGKDEPFYNPAKRDALLERKREKIEKEFKKLMPHLSLTTDFYWAGTFAETKDGLPYIGQIKQMPDTYFALGFGGNGITFSVISAEIIRDNFLGKPNADEKIFSFNR